MNVIRKNIQIACECWFTAEGKMTPLMIKLKDENGDVQTIRDVLVLSQEKLYGGCSPVTVFQCRLTLANREVNATLTFKHSEGLWMMDLC